MNDLTREERVELFESARVKNELFGGGVEHWMVIGQQTLMENKRASQAMREYKEQLDRMIGPLIALSASCDNLRHLLERSDSPMRAIESTDFPVDENESPDGVVDKSDADRI